MGKANGIDFQEKLVPVDVVRQLANGSFEHLSVRIDEAVERSRGMFVGEDDAQVARIATFPQYVVVGSSDGRYFRAPYEDVGGDIKILLPEQIDVPLVDEGNAIDFIKQYAISTVDAILSDNKEETRERILSLLSLHESVEDERDVADEVVKLLSSNREWRSLYSEQRSEIAEQISDLLGAIRDRQIDPKYSPLYNGTIPEEKFENYREVVTSGLSLVADKLEKIQTVAESAFYPFCEAIEGADKTSEEERTISKFVSFSEDFIEDIQSLREHVAFAINNEKCVMCIAQVHDAVAESLYDFDVVGSFIEKMASNFSES